jgi:hypothetical protein
VQLKEFECKVRRSPEIKIGSVFVTFIAEMCVRFGKKLFVVVDGIDESVEAKELSYDMVDLATNSSALIRVLVSSRWQTDIDRVLMKKPRLHLTPALVLQDLEAHLNSRFEKDEHLKTIGASTKVKVKKELLKRHQGM